MSIYSLVPTEKILERLHFENPWWINREAPGQYRRMAKQFFLSSRNRKKHTQSRQSYLHPLKSGGRIETM
jgi:hypothetical protein